MAIISGTEVNWVVSPRIITIPDTETEASIRDLQDTLLALEDDEEGMVWPKLRELSGGEDLGGGVTVGYTMKLLNAQLQFEGRTTPTDTGTCTQDDSTGTVLTDSAGQFITNNVTRGATVFNSTTGSMAAILTIDSETQLTSQQITGGSRTTWLNTDGYVIYDNIQCSITGGNLVAVDNVGSTISSVFQSPNTNVVRTSSSSATALSQEILESGLFEEGIIIDTVNGVAGTGTDANGNPIGTRSAPSNNIADAQTIANARSQPKFLLLSNLDITSGDFSSGYSWKGNTRSVVLTVGPSVDVSFNSYESLTFGGYSSNGNKFTNCGFVLGTNVTGEINSCYISFYIVCSGNLAVFDSYSATSGAAVIDANGNTLLVRQYHGELEIQGLTTGTSTIGLDNGSITFDSSNTGGTVYVRGQPTEIIDNSAGTLVVDETSNLTVGQNQNIQNSTDKTNEIYELLALDGTNPVTHTPTSTSSTNITIEHAGDPDTSITSTRT